MQGPKDSLLIRAKKLLDVTENSATTENEKLTASAMLSKMVMEHNLNMAEIRTGEQSPYIQQTFSTGTAYKWRHRLARLLCQYHFCDTLRSDTTHRVVIGRKDNVELVIWLHKHIRSQIEHMASQYMIELSEEKSELFMERYGGKYRNSFCDGCVTTIQTRLQQAREELYKDIENSQALVIITDEALAAKIREFFPNVSYTKARNTTNYTTPYEQGKRAGYNVTMNRLLNN